MLAHLIQRGCRRFRCRRCQEKPTKRPSVNESDREPIDITLPANLPEDVVDRAYLCAAHPHREQCRKGHGYHGGTKNQVAAALLHDAAEDHGENGHPITLADLEAAGAPIRVLAGIASMTHRPDESNEDYWARLRGNPDAVAVRNADIDDNTDPDRLALLDETKRSRLIEKYRQARAAIND